MLIRSLGFAASTASWIEVCVALGHWTRSLSTTSVAALKVFAPIFVLTKGGPGTSTIVPAYFSFYNFFTNTQVGYGAAVATVLALVVTVVAVGMLLFQTRNSEGFEK